MAQNARLRVINPDETITAEDMEVTIVQDDAAELDENGVAVTTMPDGSVVVDFKPEKPDELNSGFYANLAEKIDDGELSRIASDLLTDIENDIRSRTEWMNMREKGIELLGYKLEAPRSNLDAAPLEGMSSIRHPLLSEAVLRFQANARGELLPASGPVKVRHDAPPRPPENIPAQGIQMGEDLAQALEVDFNHYLTVVCKEYYPDTDRMLYQIGFGGLGIKKVYNCPIRRRPVSDSIDAADFIVSNDCTEIMSSGRITHRIRMRPSILKRMQLVGAYRDVELTVGTPVPPTNVELQIADIAGVKPQAAMQRNEELEQEIYECYCELDINGYEHKEKGKVTGLRLPYKVSIHVASRTILEVRRNWLKEDDLCMPREYFVDFPFVPAFGFYPLGLVHILGNTTIALTAAWREMLDAGMFSNFPGFLYSKQAGRQLSNHFRVPPGGGVGIDVGGGNIKDAIMPLPYKEVGPSFSAFIQNVEAYGQKLGSTAEMNIGEGKQEAPVGTTLALIEQATKLMDAVHKRLHAAQAKEFQLLKERFKEDPEAFWRFNRKPAHDWQKAQFLAALENNEVVPVSDPNNPTSLHRIAKATAIKQLQAASPLLYDPMAVDKRIMRVVGVDPEGLFLPKPADPPPDPRLEAIKAKSEAEALRAQQTAQQTQIKAATQAQDSLDKAADRASRERIEQLKIQLQKLKIQEEAIIHAFDEERERAKMQQQLALKAREGEQKMQLADMQHRQKLQHEREKGQMDLVAKTQEVRADAQIKAMEIEQQARLTEAATQNKMQQMQTAGSDKINQSRQAHEAKLRQADESHKQKLSQADESHKANLKATKELAKVKPKTPSNKK